MTCRREPVSTDCYRSVQASVGPPDCGRPIAGPGRPHRQGGGRGGVPRVSRGAGSGRTRGARTRSTSSCSVSWSTAWGKAPSGWTSPRTRQTADPPPHPRRLLRVLRSEGRRPDGQSFCACETTLAVVCGRTGRGRGGMVRFQQPNWISAGSEHPRALRSGVVSR